MSEQQRQQERDRREELSRKAKKATELNRYHCCMFDFMCYKSIVLYLNHHHQNEQKIMNFRDKSYWDFENIAKQSKDYDMPIISKYKEFMASYFSRINVQTKIDMTIEWMLHKNKPDALSFVEATPAFRKRLETVSGYYVFGPTNKEKVKQTIIMVKSSLPFVPSNYNSSQIGQNNNCDEAIKSQLANELKDYIPKFIQFLETRLKKEFKKKEQVQTAFKWAKMLETQGFLNWTEDITFARFVTP